MFYFKNGYWFLLVCLALGGMASPQALAQEGTDPTVVREIQELKATVKKLETIVQSQNEKINQLEEVHRNQGKASQVTQSSPPQSVPAQPVPVLAPPPESAPAPVDTQVTSNDAGTGTADQNYRQMGFWKVPVKPNSALRFIPNISLNGVFAGAYFTEDPGEFGHNPYRTGFNLQEIELALQSVIDPYITADVFLSFHEEGVELEEGYIKTLSLPKGLQVKAGKYYLAFGRQNPKHLENWPFVNNMLVNQALLGPEGFNELGVEVSYLFPTPFYLLLQTNFTQGTNEDNFDGDRKGDFAYTARLSGSGEVAQDLTLLMGTSGAFGYNNTGPGNATYLVGGDLLLSWRPSSEIGIDWQTEYIYRHRQVPYAEESEGGLYSYILGNWSKRWGAGLRVDYLGIPRFNDRTFRLSPMVTFRTTEWFRIKAQYDFVDDDVLGIQHAAFLQWIFTMGPHGPHTF